MALRNAGEGASGPRGEGVSGPRGEGASGPRGEADRPNLDAARAALGRYFGHPDFRGGQADAVRAVLAGRDVLVLMPTGGGKSLCYQVPAAVLPGLTLVVSPLISLMKDQVDALERTGLRASFVNSTLTATHVEARLAAAARGDVKLLYVAPERFAAPAFRTWLSGARVTLFAVDEAHCISLWGHDFRPSYLRLGVARAALRCPCIALTATATPEAREDILHQLRLRAPVVVARGFDRPNLSWHVVTARSVAEKDRVLIALLRRHVPRKLGGRGPPGGVAIVYASTRKSVDALADLLNRMGLPAVAYHAGVGAEDRKRLQEGFIAETVGTVIATNAFGMGIDKPNVRLVVHYHMPSSLEGYYQEAGRAGRDRQPARCVLLYAPGDERVHEFLLEQSHPPRDVVEAVHGALLTAARPDGSVRRVAAELARSTSVAGGLPQVEAALRALEKHGVVIAGSAPGALRLAGPEDATGAAVDWEALRRDRLREERKLRAMLRYIRHRGCRRGFVLRYFGDEEAMSRCDGCDNCLRGSATGGVGRRARTGFWDRLWPRR